MVYSVRVYDTYASLTNEHCIFRTEMKTLILCIVYHHRLLFVSVFARAYCMWFIKRKVTLLLIYFMNVGNCYFETMPEDVF